MSRGAGLSLRDIRANHGKIQALDGVSLDVLPGEFMVLLGPSGSGKSTLLAAIAGLQDMVTGRVLLGGRDVTFMEPADRNMAIVFQSYALYPTMTVARNITFGMRMRGVRRAEAALKLADVARLLQIEALLDRKPAQLSGGQKQRVAIGRAIVRDPELFLFDEPLSNLDAMLRMEMRGELQLLHRRLGTTIVYVTHDQIEAMTMASRIAVMRDGQILQVGTPRAVYDRPECLFVAGFVGVPRMNFLSGRVAHRGRGIAVGADEIMLPLHNYSWVTQPAEGRLVVLGLRHEDVSVPNDQDTFVTTMTPTLMEPTGADASLRLTFAGTEITARVHRNQEVGFGEPMLVAMNLRNASVFCPVSQRRL